MGVKRLIGGLLSFVGIVGVFKASNGFGGGMRISIPTGGKVEPMGKTLVSSAGVIPAQGKSVSGVNERDKDILARTMWGEARNQGERGMQAVANVVMNRTRSSRWPNTPADVCLQTWQFSAWNTGDPNRAKMQTVTVNDSRFRSALAIAEQALRGQLADITGGADHYHTNGVAPYWSKGVSPVAVIGDHKFFKLG